MKMRTFGQVRQRGFSALAFTLAFLITGVAVASDVERQIPVIKDSAGSGVSMEISQEGTRQTVTPALTLNNPTLQRIEDRVARKITQLAAKGIPAGAIAPDSLSRIGVSGTPSDNSKRPETALSSLPALPGEITIRSMRHFIKGLRASRKEKPSPAVVAEVPEQRLGMVDTSLR